MILVYGTMLGAIPYSYNIVGIILISQIRKQFIDLKITEVTEQIDV